MKDGWKYLARWLIIFSITIFVGMIISTTFGDTVSEDPSGNVFIKTTDGTSVKCFVVGSGPTQKLICTSN